MLTKVEQINDKLILHEEYLPSILKVRYPNTVSSDFVSLDFRHTFCVGIADLIVHLLRKPKVVAYNHVPLRGVAHDDERFTSYLKKRCQHVCFNNSHSKRLPVTFRVLQESILGIESLLFLLYINGLNTYNKMLLLGSLNWIIWGGGV